MICISIGAHKKMVSPCRWESFMKTPAKMFDMLTSLWFPNEFRLFWLHSIKRQYLNTAKKFANSVDSLEGRERQRTAWMRTQFRISILGEITCSKMFSKQLQIGISGNSTSVCDLKCVYVFVCLFYFMSQQNFLHMKMFTHFIWHAMCTAFHWMESFKRAHIDFSVENQTSNRMWTCTKHKKLFRA